MGTSSPFHTSFKTYHKCYDSGIPPLPLVCSQYLQTMYNCASFPPVVLLLPLLHLADELQEGALGNWRVSVHGPSQELELLHHPIAILGL